MSAILEGKVGVKGSAPPPGLPTIDIRRQLVSVDDSAVIVDAAGAAATFADVPLGGRISVYGFPDASGKIRATRIEIRPGSSEQIEVRGFVSGLDATAKTFTLTVAPSAPTPLAVTLAAAAALPAGLANGSYVEVRSAAAPLTPNGATIVDATVSLEDRGIGANREAEVEGIVTAGDSAAFTVLGIAVATGGATTWENGTPADLLPGVKVEAEGRLDASGVLQARKVSFRSNIRIQGVPVLDTATTFQLLGFNVRLDEFTDLNTTVGASAVEVRARRHANGTDLVATRIDDAGGDSRIYLQGPVTAANATGRTLSILGITVDVSSAELRDANDGAITGAGRFTTFFGLISPPATVVKARGSGPGSLAGSVLTAEEAEIEGTR
jgi:hypothetical protein